MFLARRAMRLGLPLAMTDAVALSRASLKSCDVIERVTLGSMRSLDQAGLVASPGLAHVLIQ
jgi:hypothetical protein